MARAQVSSWSATSRSSTLLPAAIVQGACTMSVAFSAACTWSPPAAMRLAMLSAMPSITVVIVALWRFIALWMAMPSGTLPPMLLMRTVIASASSSARSRTNCAADTDSDHHDSPMSP